MKKTSAFFRIIFLSQLIIAGVIHPSSAMAQGTENVAQVTPTAEDGGEGREPKIKHLTQRNLERFDPGAWTLVEPSKCLDILKAELKINNDLINNIKLLQTLRFEKASSVLGIKRYRRLNQDTRKLESERDALGKKYSEISNIVNEGTKEKRLDIVVWVHEQILITKSALGFRREKRAANIDEFDKEKMVVLKSLLEKAFYKEYEALKRQQLGDEEKYLRSMENHRFFLERRVLFGLLDFAASTPIKMDPKLRKKIKERAEVVYQKLVQ